MSDEKTINVNPVDDSYEEWEFSFPYSAPLNDELKTRVPSAERRWDPESKCWVVTDKWKEFTLGLVVRYLPGVRVVESDV